MKTRCASCRATMHVAMELLCDVECPGCGEVVCDECVNGDMQKCQLCLADAEEET